MTPLSRKNVNSLFDFSLGFDISIFSYPYHRSRLINFGFLRSAENFREVCAQEKSVGTHILQGMLLSTVLMG